MIDGATRVEHVYRRMRADILGGHVAPGSQLAFAGLRAAYGASMGVLREALTRLTAEGLAVAEAQRGFRVVSLSLDDLRDLTDTRVMIEGAVLAESIEHGDLDWEARVVAARHRMEGTPKHAPDGTVTTAWSEAHQAFHIALLSASRSPRKLVIAANLRAAAEVYRRWSIPFEVIPRDVSAEHAAIEAATLARDARTAVALLTSHLSLTRDLIVGGVVERAVR